MQTEIVDQFVGQVVGKQGQYRVERLLGQSRLNAVYLARNLSDQQVVALTLFMTPEHFSLDAYQRFIQRFTTAAPALVALEHPHILRVYEFGEQYGYPYLITPYLTNGSLADLLRKQQRFSYEEVLSWLEQVGPAIEFAHRRGQIHGTLKPANLVFNSKKQLQVAGFGLMHILQLSGIAQSQQPFAHLLSLAEMFLVAPEYLAPEVVEGRSIDKRSDVYALGCILFELLSGSPPFKGDDPLTVAQMHVKQQMPSLRTLVPDLPIALTSVVHQALERDPQRRFQQVSDVVEAFSQVVSGVTNVWRSAPSDGDSTDLRTRRLPDDPAEEPGSTGWQLMPPIVTGKMAAIPAKPSPTGKQPTPSATTSQFAPLGRLTTGHLKAVPATRETSPLSPRTPARVEQPRMVEPPAANTMRQSSSLPPQDARERYAPPAADARPQSGPIPRQDRPAPRQEAPQRGVNLAEDAAWWTQQPSGSIPALPSQDMRRQRKTKTAQLQPPSRASNDSVYAYANMSQKRSSGPGRRKVLAVLAAGGIVAAGALLANNAHLFQHMMPAQQSNGAAAPTKMPQTTSPSAPQKKATQPAAPKAPTHTGTVIGSTKQLVDSSQQFNDPADGKSSLLIHLPNGNFVAYKQACTHEGVSVNYDPNTHTLVCPAHGAIFDPAKAGAVLQGPAVTPIPSVGIRVNSDGTITTL